MTEFGFTYHSSMASYNMADDLAYTLVVNGSTLMLTPLGKLLMPPPMSEKEVKVEGVPTCVCMFSHKAFLATASGACFLLDCDSAEVTKF